MYGDYPVTGTLMENNLVRNEERYEMGFPTISIGTIWSNGDM